MKTDNISHDDYVWYHNDDNTCVAYTEDESIIDDYSSVHVGTHEEQLREVKRAIDNGGVHPHCPLLYLFTE